MYEFLIQTNIPIFHHSIIPSGLNETCSIKIIVISMSYTISETFSFILIQINLLEQIMTRGFKKVLIIRPLISPLPLPSHIQSFKGVILRPQRALKVNSTL